MHSTATSGFAALIVFPMSDADLHAQLRPSPIDVADVLPDLLRIDVDGADDAEALREATCRATAAPIGSETDMHHANHGVIMVRACRERSCNSRHNVGVRADSAARRSRPPLCGADRRLPSPRGRNARRAAGRPAEHAFDHAARGRARSPRNANYEIDVAARSRRARRCTGSETHPLAQHQRDDPTTELQFHLYWNAWRNADSTWLRERRLGRHSTSRRGRMRGARCDVTSIRVRDASGGLRRPHAARCASSPPTTATRADRTVMSVPLGRRVEPNETVEIEIEWTAKIPRPFARTGCIGDYYFIAQWFPKIGVLEDGRLEHAPVPRRDRVLRRLRRLRRPPDRARAASSSAPPAVRPRARTTPTARRHTAIAAKTSTTSPGRPARTSSIDAAVRAPDAAAVDDAAAPAARASRAGGSLLRDTTPR